MLLGHFRVLAPVYKDVEFLPALPLNLNLYNAEESTVFRQH